MLGSTDSSFRALVCRWFNACAAADVWPATTVAPHDGLHGPAQCMTIALPDHISLPGEGRFVHLFSSDLEKAWAVLETIIPQLALGERVQG
jgi:hypothetical protein